ncbi:MAG TPA: transposase [Chloroflexota bacterium]|jgi:hypothetical protein
MDVVYARCCGLALHKRTGVAGRLVPGPDGTPEKAIRTFGTMTADLLELADWRGAAGVTHVAMEAPGVSGKPLDPLLADQCTRLRVTAQHSKAVPGRKPAVRDSEGLAELLGHGVRRASCVPARPQRERRALTRYRPARGQARRAARNRLPQTLAGAHSKLAAVVSPGRGKFARALLAARVAGAAAAAALAAWARGRRREQRGALPPALAGRFGAPQRVLVAPQRAPRDSRAAAVTPVSTASAARLQASAEARPRLTPSPGVGRRGAASCAAAVGTARSRLPTAGQLAAWAGMAPGNNERAGTRRPAQSRQGRPQRRARLVEAGPAAGRTQDTYVAAQYHRLAARRGKKRAAVAVGQPLLVIAYHRLPRGTCYEELGGDDFDAPDRAAVARRLVRRLEALGHPVTRAPSQPAA